MFSLGILVDRVVRGICIFKSFDLQTELAVFFLEKKTYVLWVVNDALTLEWKSGSGVIDLPVEVTIPRIEIDVVLD